MRRVTFPLATVLCGLLIAGCGDQGAMEDAETAEEAAPAEMPAAPSLADFAGTWEAFAYMESGDTVPHTLTATATTEGWMIDLPDRDPMPMRIVEASGDSVVSVIGPYESILRPGVMVTVRSVSRVEGDRLVGTMEATYQGGEGESVVTGTVEGTRGM